MEEIMNVINSIVGWMGDFAWGPFTIVFLVGTGLYLSIITKFIQFRKLGTSFRLLFTHRDTKEAGDISPFSALMTSLSATIGTGNIVGVSTAIASGGPGAVFWMWVTALVGGASKYTEALLAVKFREVNAKGEYSGGPMYYIKNGMGKRWTWLAALFAFFGFIASFGIGNLSQSNSVAGAVHDTFGVATWITGIIIAVATALVIIGGVKSIGRVSDKIVPFMSVAYIIVAVTAIVINFHKLPEAFSWIFGNAFTGQAIGGGLLGSVIRFGVARGVFSNEAGMGSAAIAHGAASTNDPVKQGLIGSLGSFIDSIIICSMTALIILTSPVVNMGADGLMTLQANDGIAYPITMAETLEADGVKFLEGAEITNAAMNSAIPGWGGTIISIALIFFAYSTILGWYYYGSKCLEYLAGLKAVAIYKWVFVGFCLLGATTKIDLVWNLSDAFNGLMAIPNLIAMLALSPIVIKMTKEYDQKQKEKNK